MKHPAVPTRRICQVCGKANPLDVACTHVPDPPKFKEDTVPTKIEVHVEWRGARDPIHPRKWVVRQGNAIVNYNKDYNKVVQMGRDHTEAARGWLIIHDKGGAVVSTQGYRALPSRRVGKRAR